MPAFKTNLDIQQKQLLNAVLHKLNGLPPNPVEGQLYYNGSRHSAYVWNGSSWIALGNSSGLGVSETRQFVTTILNPSPGSGAIMVRLYEAATCMRVDAHFSTVNTVYFSIEARENVNREGTLLTNSPMIATNDGDSYTDFDYDNLSGDDWIYLSIVSDPGEGGVPATGGTGSTPENVEVLGVLTLVLTCSV